jgi:HlyD family secretion protein
MIFKRIRKRWYIIAAVVVVAILAVSATMNGSGNEGTAVQAELALLDDISEIVTASGRIEPQTKVDITAEVSAQILEVYVREGDEVFRGQELLLLDTVQYQSDAAQARYSLDEVKARTSASHTLYEKDKLEYERQTALFEQKLTSENAFTDAEFAYQNSEANYNAMLAQSRTAKAALEKALDNLSKTTIVAPMSGVITYLSAEAGEVAQAQTAFTQGKTLMTIADLSVFEVEVDVDETEITKLAYNQPAEIRVDAFRDTSFSGSVVEIGNSAIIQGEGTESYSTSFRVKIRLNEENVAVRPGMSASVDITTARAADAVLVPYAAVVTREIEPDTVDSAEVADTSLNQLASARTSEEDNSAKKKSKNKDDELKTSGVFLVRDGVAEFVAIETGIADDRNIVALTGVAPGDTVVSGSFRTLRELKDGDPVHIDERSRTEMDENSD